MKKITLLFGFLLFVIMAIGQNPDQTFEKVLYAKGGVKFIDGSILSSAGLQSGTVSWSLIINKPTTLSGYGITDAFSGTWSSIIGKPLLFPPETHNHNLLYKPINYVPDWSEILNKPLEISLIDVILSKSGLPIPKYTTIQINALIPSQEGVLIYDTTLHLMKYWNGSIWKTFITNQ